MDLLPHSEPEFTVVSTTNTAESAPYPGAFFPHATGFTIRGGEFTTNNITNHFHTPPEEEFSAFELIRLGNINLLKEFKEMRIDDSGVVGWRSRGASVRRMYTAELRRDPGRVTVAMYEGDGAEEEWRKHIAKYESIRHPYIMQLYGLVRTKGLCAMVFHDELIPYEQFLNRSRNSPILNAYIRCYCVTEYRDVHSYLREIHPSRDFEDMSVWIRPSTGNICVELVPAPQLHDFFWWPEHKGRYMEDVSLDNPEAEAEVILNFDEDEYHRLCSQPPVAQFRSFTISTQPPLGLLGSIVRANAQDGSFVRVTEPLVFGSQKPRWGNVGDEAEVLTSSWSRYDSRGTCGLELSIELWRDSDVRVEEFWLAQANYTFTRLEATSHTEDYVCVYGIRLILQCLPNTHSTCEPEGYLFVCPAEDFQTRQDLYSWPECPAYWSLNPSGVPRLSTEDAKILGFPIIHIETILEGCYWKDSVYEGLRRFHKGKGFIPDSQDLALHLDYPLYELSTDMTPIACRPLPSWPGYRCDHQDSALCEEFGHFLP